MTQLCVSRDMKHLESLGIPQEWSLRLEQLLRLLSALQTSRVLLNGVPQRFVSFTWRTSHGRKTKHTSCKGLLSVLSLQKDELAHCYFKSTTSTFSQRSNLVPRSLVEEAVRDYSEVLVPTL